MRFGEKFALHRRPAWEQFYLPYDRLKVLLKNTTSDSPPIDLGGTYCCFQSCLENSIAVLESFFKKHCELLKHKEKTIIRHYNLEGGGRRPLLSKTRVHEDLQTFITQQSTDYKELYLLARLNQESLARIRNRLAKIDARSFQHDHAVKTWDFPNFEEACLKQLHDMQNYLRNPAPRDPADVVMPLKSVSSQESLQERLSPENVSEASPNYLPPELLQELEDASWSPELFLSVLRESTMDALEQSIDFQAWKCASFLLKSGFISEGSMQVDLLNALIGVTSRSLSKPRATSDLETLDQATSAAENVFRLLLSHLGDRRTEYLSSPDGVGRLPLHYCSESGLLGMCCSMEEIARENGRGSGKVFANIILAKDNEGFTPLDLAVIHGHVAIAKLYFSTLESESSAQGPAFKSTLGNLLLIAIKSQDDAMVTLIAGKNVNVLYQPNLNGETVLHAVAQLGREDYARQLLKVARRQNANIDIRDAIRSWTPLFVASARGNLAIVELFLNVGADKTLVDCDGWTAQEHAALRGHLAVAERLRENSNPSTLAQSQGAFVAPAAGKRGLSSNFSGFIFNLGPMQQNRQVVDHDFEILQRQFPDAVLSVEVASLSQPAVSRVFRYPFLDDLASCDLLLPSDNPDRERLMFKLWFSHFDPSGSRSETKHLVGSGVATLHDNRACFGLQRESLIREHSVTILKKETMDFLGSISFTVVKATSFPGLNAPVSSDWDSVQIHGHRGNGQNLGNQKYLQLGENTIGSFLSAAKHGATHVEVTRDLVPVLFHDFSLSESGTDVPIHDLTYQQFMYASNVQSPRGDPLSMLGDVQSAEQTPQLPRIRSRSLTKDQEKGAKEVQDRMRHTVDYRAKGFKPNTRGSFIQDTFATLEEALLQVPEHIGFNIEIKYPRIHEALGAGVGPVSLDLNTFIDTVLDMIVRCNKKANSKRPIVLSSFTPEVCMLLRLKQQAYPIVFISNGGKLPVEDHDVRAANVQTAVRFARKWGLDGVIFAAEVFKTCPELIRRVRSKGLRCGSYGGLNGEVETVEAQVRAGVDVLIADRVSLVKDTVRRLEAEAEAE
ncbi:Glycerophosphoryl diester phosphodiesterase family-domain-containing protein, partial [Phyllosticta capitalensis]